MFVSRHGWLALCWTFAASSLGFNVDNVTAAGRCLYFPCVTLARRRIIPFSTAWCISIDTIYLSMLYPWNVRCAAASSLFSFFGAGLLTRVFLTRRRYPFCVSIAAEHAYVVARLLPSIYHSKRDVLGVMEFSCLIVLLLCSDSLCSLNNLFNTCAMKAPSVDTYNWKRVFNGYTDDMLYIVPSGL